MIDGHSLGCIRLREPNSGRRKGSCRIVAATYIPNSSERPRRANRPHSGPRRAGRADAPDLRTRNNRPPSPQQT